MTTTTAPASARLANPRRTTLAALRSGTRCQVAAPGCGGTATRLLVAADRTLPACSSCAAGCAHRAA